MGHFKSIAELLQYLRKKDKMRVRCLNQHCTQHNELAIKVNIQLLNVLYTIELSWFQRRSFHTWENVTNKQLWRILKILKGAHSDSNQICFIWFSHLLILPYSFETICFHVLSPVAQPVISWYKTYRRVLLYFIFKIY